MNPHRPDLSRRGFLKGTGAALGAAALAPRPAPAADEPADGKVPDVVLGRTGVRVSRLGIGCAYFQRKRVTPDDVRKTLFRALDLGVNYLDVYLRKGWIPALLPLPGVPGMEAVGTVVDVGTAVSGVLPGDRVDGDVTHGAAAARVSPRWARGRPRTYRAARAPRAPRTCPRSRRRSRSRTSRSSGC